MATTGNAELRPDVSTLLRELTHILQERLPPGWRARTQKLPRRSATVDALLELKGPNGAGARLDVEVARFAGPSSIERAIEALRQYGGEGTGVVVAPYVPLAARERLSQTGVGYVDLTGNILLRTTQPALFIRDVGENRNPWRAASAPVSLRGTSAARIVRALCDYKPPIGIRVLAVRSGASAGYVSKLLSLLEREGLIERATRSAEVPDSKGADRTPVASAQRGPVVATDWRGLIDRWTRDYSFTRSNRMKQFLEPRGIEAVVRKLKNVDARYALTGAIAAARVTSVAPAIVVAAFTENARTFAEQLELKQVPRSGNVLLTEPFADLVYERSVNEGGLRYAAFSQVLADLKTSPGRARSESEALEDWMAANEPRWRLA